MRDVIALRTRRGRLTLPPRRMEHLSRGGVQTFMSFSLIDIWTHCCGSWPWSDIALATRVVFEAAPHNIQPNTGLSWIWIEWPNGTLEPRLLKAALGAIPATLIALTRSWRA